MKRLISAILVALVLFSSVPFGSLSVLAASSDKIDGVDASVIEKAMKNAISTSEPSVTLSSYGIEFNTTNAKKIKNLYDSIIDSNPTFFHVKNYAISYIKNGDIVSIKFNYQYSKSTYQTMLSKVESKANSIISDLKGKNLTDTEIALLLHDRLAVLCEYDYVNFEKYLNGDEDAIPFDAFNIYGVFINNIAVCEGYSYAYKYLLNKMGVEAEVCRSDYMQHMWNVVEIDGKKYHVDLTYNDPSYDMTGRVMHEYFLLSTDALKEKGHNTDNITNTEPNTTKYDNYFWQDVHSQFCYLDGKIYYIDENSETLNSYYSGESEELISVEDDWYKEQNLRYLDNYARLDNDGKLLYYNLTDTIYSYNPKTNENKSIYTPNTSGHENFSIFGFKVKDGSFYYDLNNGVYDETTKKLYGGTFRYHNCISYSTVTLSTNTYTYSGSAKTPAPRVLLDGKTLKKGTDYTVTYSNNKNAGSAKVIIKAMGKYSGRIIKTFKIKPKSITKLTFTKISNKTYTGKKIKPSVTVKNGKTKLTNNKDYTISYGTNKSTGKGTVTIKGKGNYEGSKKITFYIVPKKVSITKSAPKKRAIYIKWKKATGASGYQIAYRKMGGNKYKYTTTTKLKKTIKSLTSKKYHQVKVRAYKTVNGKKIYGEWSKVKKVKIK